MISEIIYMTSSPQWTKPIDCYHPILVMNCLNNINQAIRPWEVLSMGLKIDSLPTPTTMSHHHLAQQPTYPLSNRLHADDLSAWLRSSLGLLIGMTFSPTTRQEDSKEGTSLTSRPSFHQRQLAWGGWRSRWLRKSEREKESEAVMRKRVSDLLALLDLQKWTWQE